MARRSRRSAPSSFTRFRLRIAALAPVNSAANAAFSSVSAATRSAEALAAALASRARFSSCLSARPERRLFRVVGGDGVGGIEAFRRASIARRGPRRLSRPRSPADASSSRSAQRSSAALDLGLGVGEVTARRRQGRRGGVGEFAQGDADARSVAPTRGGASTRARRRASAARRRSSTSATSADARRF